VIIFASFPEDFNIAHGHTLRDDIEGGKYSGDEAFDPNPTNLGVTLNTLISMGAWADLDHDGDVDRDDLRKLSKEDSKQVYYPRYWLASSCDKLPLPVAVCHFDTAVNMGPKAANVILQLAAGLTGREADGVLGPVSLDHIHAHAPKDLANSQCWTRLEAYHRLVLANKAKRPALTHWVYRTCEAHSFSLTL
jgi:lysozyme family protein